MTYNIRDDNGTLLGTVNADPNNGDLVIEHAQSGEQARLNSDGLDVSAVSTDSLSLTPVVDDTISVSSGGTSRYGVLENTADPYLVSVIPANDPGNDHGYEHHLEWDVSGGAGDGRVDIVINETANAGGGDARILVWRITP
jgi:hypothetical protein